MNTITANINKIKERCCARYSAEFPVEKHLLYPVEEILLAARVIIWDYKEWNKPEEWYVGAQVLRKNMYQLSAEETKNLLYGHMYRKLFSFLRPNKETIERLVDYFDYHDIPPIPSEKMLRYLAILPEIAEDCIELCLEELKEDAKKEVKTRYDKPYHVDKILKVRLSHQEGETKQAKAVRWADSVTGGEKDRKDYIKKHQAAKKQKHHTQESGGTRAVKS
jgi:hypothetical protein